MVNAMKTGWTMTPTTKSVDASNASKMFDFCALSRGFTFTASIVSAFKTAVKGKVRMLMIIMKINTAWTMEEDWWSLPPSWKYVSHSEGIISTLGRLEFLFSSFSWFLKSEIWWSQFSRYLFPWNWFISNVVRTKNYKKVLCNKCVGK